MSDSLPIQVVALLPGQKTLDLSDQQTGGSWTTNAIGGFGSASFTLPGPPRRWVRDLPKLSLIRVFCGSTLLWEGQLEDHDLAVSGGELSTTIQCFGLGRLFSENSVRRIWSSRSLPLNQRAGLLAQPGLTPTTGNFDATDLTKSGIAFFGSGQTSTAALGGIQYRMRPSVGLTIVRAMFSYDKAGAAGLTAIFYSSADLSTYTSHLSSSANVTASAQSVALVATAMDVLFAADYASAVATAASDFVKFYNIRILGTSLTEDATGGFYGDTILKDLIGLCPGLTAGVIESGSDFTIQSVERSVRAAALDVVQEVVGYYAREWGVWEGGRFDWKTPNLNEPTWTIDLADLAGLNLRSSVDSMSATDYVLYTDAASGLDAEASATNTNRRNPYTLRGRAKDTLISPGFPMTTNTSAQLAATLNADHGVNPQVSGSCNLNCTTPVTRLNEGLMPAYAIRAGDNIKINGLPKDDPFLLGRDGQTLFHITSTQVSADGQVTLTLDSQASAIDSLMARLAAATRVLTG